MIRLAKKIFWEGQKTRLELCEEHLKDPLAALANTGKVRRIPIKVCIFTVCRCQPLSLQWRSASLAQRFCKRCAKGPIGKASGLTLTHGMLCVCQHHLASGMCWRSTGHMASSFSSSSTRSPSLLQRQCSLSPLFLRRPSRHVL